MKCFLCNKNTGIVIARRLREGSRRSVFYCPRCSLGILNSGMTESECEYYYKNEYRKFHKPILNRDCKPSELFNTYAGLQGYRLRTLKPFLARRMKLLELGCSAGQFLYNVRPYVRETYGWDFDTKALSFAQRRVGCKKWDRREKEFDVICAFDVLEHVQDPIGYLRSVSQFLKPRGIIMIEVPNLRDSLVSLYDLPQHHRFYFHKAHLSYFTKESLLVLMRRAGFAGRVNFIQDYNIINHMNWLINGRPQTSCIGGLSDVKIIFKGSKYLKNASISKNKLGAFIKDMDLRYKKLLESCGIASKIIFIGHKRP